MASRGAEDISVSPRVEKPPDALNPVADEGATAASKVVDVFLGLPAKKPPMPFEA